MSTANKILYFLALTALLCVPLVVAFAATGTPEVGLGYDWEVDYKAAVRYQSFNNDKSPGAYEAELGDAGFPAGSETIDFYKGQTCSGSTPIGSWKTGNNSNHVTFSYDPATGILSTMIQATYAYCKDIYLGDLGPLNYIKIVVSNMGKTSVAFNDMGIDGLPIGYDFSTAPGTLTTWNIMGLTFTEGFTIEGDILLSKNQAGRDQNMVEITVGHYDVLGPLVTSDVDVSQPVYLNGQAVVSATVDDEDTYGSDIASADFDLDGGLWSGWLPMTALDGAFDEVQEDVFAEFTAAADVGMHTTCVRATDNFWIPRTGEVQCQNFVVDYVFAGFFDPIDNELTNDAKAGRAIPVKWRLTDALGAPIENPDSFAGFYSYPINCGDTTTSLEDAVEEYAAGDSGLQYLGDGNWQYNWKTPKDYSDTCRVMYVEFKSGTTSPLVEFKFK